MLVYFVDHETNKVVKEAKIDRCPESDTFDYIANELSGEIVKEKKIRDPSIIDGFIFEMEYTVLGNYIIVIDFIRR